LVVGLGLKNASFFDIKKALDRPTIGHGFAKVQYK
jgi:hypothetical protein